MGSALFIGGTGTDVGKTALSLAVLLWARDRGLRAAYHKPIQCGTFAIGSPPMQGGDADWIRKLAGSGTAAHVTYQLRMAASPHLAAEREQVALDLRRIRSDAQALLAENDLLILEGSGGTAVPIDRRGNTLAALAADLGIPCLLACAPGLGTLHHTLSTLAHLGNAGCQTAGFAFCHRTAEEDGLARDNRETLAALTSLPFFGDLGFLESIAQGRGPAADEEESWYAPLAPALAAWWRTAAE